jgi:hypothetical protein
MKMALRTLAENAIIVVGIVSLWPWILGRRSGWYQCAIVIMLVLLSVLAVIRFLRIKRAIEQRKELSPGAGPPRERGPQ